MTTALDTYINACSKAALIVLIAAVPYVSIFLDGPWYERAGAALVCTYGALRFAPLVGDSRRSVDNPHEPRQEVGNFVGKERPPIDHDAEGIIAIDDV